MDEFPILKLSQGRPLTGDERRAVLAVLGEELAFKAGADIATDGAKPGFSTVLLEGWAWRYKLLPDGRRQILSINIPGDWTDLHSYFLHTLDHSVGAITPCRVAKIPHARIKALIEDQPRFAQLLWRDMAVEAATHREWIVNLGSRRSDERLAHFLCELWVRLNAIGESDGEAFPLRLTQQDIADIIGVSTVHTNRVIQNLTQRGVLRLGGGKCAIPDIDRLKQVAGFDARYLHLAEGPPVGDRAP
jgi:CRP-like cAMP-binding protein